MSTRLCDICNMMYCDDIPSDVELHGQTHDLAVNGVPATLDAIGAPCPANTPWPITLVTVDDPLAMRSLVAAVSLRARRSLPRDSTFSWWPYHVDAKPDPALQPRFFLAHNNQADLRVIGFAAFLRRPYHYPMRWDASMSDGIVHTPTWCVEMVWTAHNYQRTGCATALLHAAFAHLGSTPDQVSWSHPFSQAGAAVVRRFSPVEFNAWA